MMMGCDLLLFVLNSFPMRMSEEQHLEPWASFVELSTKCGRRILQKLITRVKSNTVVGTFASREVSLCATVEIKWACMNFYTY